MTVTLERRPGSKYTAEQIEDGLMALALCNGSSRAAERLLAANDATTVIPFRTLQVWKTTYAQRLSEVEKRVEDQIWRKSSRKWRRIVDEAQDVGLNAIDATRKAIASDDPKAASSWSGTAKNLGIIGGIGTEKAAGIDGRPMHHIEAHGINDIIRKLERFPGVLKVNRAVVDSTATEVSLPAADTPRATEADEQKETPDPLPATQTLTPPANRIAKPHTGQG